MIKIEDIEPGKSYACKYIDLTGTECVAVIHTRDTAAKLVEVCDVESQMMMTLAYENIFDVDTVIWQEQKI